MHATGQEKVLFFVTVFFASTAQCALRGEGIAGQLGIVVDTCYLSTCQAEVKGFLQVKARKA